jgi:hypothetical protein
LNQVSWISLIALLGWLVLALSAFRSHRIDTRKALMMALAWATVFLLVAGVFVAIGH